MIHHSRHTREHRSKLYYAVQGCAAGVVKRGRHFTALDSTGLFYEAHPRFRIYEIVARYEDSGVSTQCLPGVYLPKWHLAFTTASRPLGPRIRTETLSRYADLVEVSIDCRQGCHASSGDRQQLHSLTLLIGLSPSHCLPWYDANLRKERWVW